MSSYKLPTYLDIAKHYLFIFTNKKTTLAATTDRILEIWFSASIPSIHRRCVLQKIERYIKIINTLWKDVSKHIFEAKLKIHIEKYNILFDICSCKCRDYDMCRYSIKEKRISFAEIVFFIDQRTERRMHINIDRTVPTTPQSRIASTRK